MKTHAKSKLNNPSLVLAMRIIDRQAELLLIRDGAVVDRVVFEAFRVLSDVINKRIESILKKNGANFDELTGVVVHRGPGSFMSLRIMLTTANAIAFVLKIPIIGVAKNVSDNWWVTAYKKTLKTYNSQLVTRNSQLFVPVLPHYGAKPTITKKRR